MDKEPGFVAELFGRESALTTVKHHTAAARTGHGAQAVAICGDRGSGKSAVLRNVAATESRGGAIVLSAVGRGERGVLAVARRLLVQAGIIVPDLTDPCSADLYRVYRSMWRDLADLAEHTPVCLVLDDLDACDPDTVRWLDFVLRRLSGQRIAIVLSRGRTLTVDIDLARCHVVDLPPLTSTQIADMIATTLHFTPDAQFVSLCLGLSGGNPRHLTTVLADIRAAKALRPESVEVVAARRLRDQPAHLRAIAAALVVVERDELVPSLAGVSGRVAHDGIAVLRREHLLGDTLPDHVKRWFRAGLLDVLAPAEIADLRHRAAVVLDEAGHDVRAVADQLVHLPEVDTPWMSQVLRQAAAGGEPEDASRYLCRLVELRPDDVELRVNLATELSRHDPVRACEHLAAAFHRTSDPDLRAALAVKHALTGRTRTFLRIAKDSAVSEDLSTLLDAVQLALDLEDATTAAAAVARAVPPPAADTTAQRCLLGVVAEATMRGGGSIEDAVRYARQALSDADALTDWAMMSAATVLRVAGHTDEALAVLDRAVEGFGHNGDSLARCRALVQRSLVHLSLGNVPRAVVDATDAVKAVRDGGWNFPRAFVLMAWMCMQQGQVEQAEQLLTEVDASSLRHMTLVHREYLRAMAFIAFSRGDLGLAADRMSQCATEMTSIGLSDPSALLTWTDVVFLLTLAGRDATFALREVDRLAKAWPSREAVAMSLLARGFVTTGMAALDMVRAASEAFAAVPSLIQQARAEFLLGQRWLGAGDAKQARAHLRTAVGLAMRAGHRPLTDEARSMLLGAGGRMPAPSTVDGLAVLTPGERRVVELAATGATNRVIADHLFVTLRTVEVHLTRAYRKLGITGRAELADVLAS